MNENVGSEAPPVCKHNQIGYCKYGNQCHKPHNNNICKERVCRNKNCRERHPRSCRYFNLNGWCKFKKCSYAHKKLAINDKVETLEVEIDDLKKQVAELNNNVNEMMKRLKNFEEIEDNTTTKEPTTHHNEEFKCKKCNFKCDREITFMKHTNTMHSYTVTQIPKPKQKCCFCDYQFSTDKEFNIHLQKHLVEIKEMEPENQLDIQDSFK